MKIRTGFVSNSSSSSFCIYGTEIDSDDMKVIAENLKLQISEEDSDDLEYAIEEALEKELRGSSISFHYGPDSSKFIGREWTSINNDETGGQFKDTVNTFLEKYLPNATASTFEDGWYDG